MKQVRTGVLAILGVTIGGVMMLSTHSIKSAAKTRIISHQALKTRANTRNVEPTGKAGLYSKPSALQGEKQLLSKKAMKQMDRSEDPGDYFRAYRMAKTNTNSVYYKVVSFDGRYRGWVYGGKKVNRFAKGLHRADTYDEVPLSTVEKTAAYYFTDPGTKHVTWRAPYGTTYKPAKAVLSTMPYAKDTLTLKSAVKREKGDDVYYYVGNARHPEMNGWIYSKAVAVKKDVDQSESTSSSTGKPVEPASPGSNAVQPAPNSPGSSGGGTITLTGLFSHTDASVLKNAVSPETDQAIVSKVQKQYREAVIANLPEPFHYDSSMSLAELSKKLGHGQHFTLDNGRRYVVVVNPASRTLVTLVPQSQVKWLNVQTAVSGLDSGLLGMLLNDDLKRQVQSAANLYYKLNYLGSLVILSPMSDKTVKQLLGDGRQLKINIESFFEELPITVRFDIGVTITRDANGISAVTVDLKLDPDSLKVPTPANPAKCRLDIDVSQLELNFWEVPLAKGAIKLFYPMRYPYYDKIPQEMSPDKIRRVLGNGKTITIDQSGIKANLTMAVDVSQEAGLSKSVIVKVTADKLAENK